MEHNTSNPSNKSRKTLLIGIAVVAIIAVVYFSFFYPPTTNDQTSGTIGAAKKYRSEQITDKDVKLEGMQSTASADQTISTDVVGDLRNAAESLEKTVADFGKSPNAKLDRTFTRNLEKAADAAINAAKVAADRPPGRPHATFENAAAAVSLQKDIAALEMSIKEVMNRTEAVASYQKAPSGTSLEKAQSATSLEKAQSATSLEKAQSATSLEKAQSATSLEKAQSATSLEKAQSVKSLEKAQSATSLEKAQSVKSLEKADHAKMDRAAELKEINNRAQEVINNVAQFEKTWRATLEKDAANKE